MRALRFVVGVNFVLSAVSVFVWIGFGHLLGLPMDSECMGFQRGFRFPQEPAWVTPFAVEGAFLVAFCFRRPLGEHKVRLFVGGIAAFDLLFMLVLPILMSEVYGTKFYSFDRALWWYACASNILYGLVGTTSTDY